VLESATSAISSMLERTFVPSLTQMQLPGSPAQRGRLHVSQRGCLPPLPATATAAQVPLVQPPILPNPAPTPPDPAAYFTTQVDARSDWRSTTTSRSCSSSHAVLAEDDVEVERARGAKALQLMEHREPMLSANQDGTEHSSLEDNGEEKKHMQHSAGIEPRPQHLQRADQDGVQMQGRVPATGSTSASTLETEELDAELARLESSAHLAARKSRRDRSKALCVFPPTMLCRVNELMQQSPGDDKQPRNVAALILLLRKAFRLYEKARRHNDDSEAMHGTESSHQPEVMPATGILAAPTAVVAAVADSSVSVSPLWAASSSLLPLVDESSLHHSLLVHVELQLRSWRPIMDNFTLAEDGQQSFRLTN
jgi:hypothetical protein